MSESIELKINLPLPPAPTEPSAPNETLPSLPDLPTFGGSENGAVFFELNWQTGQAQNLQQNLMANYAADDATPTTFDSGTPTNIFAADPNNNQSVTANYRLTVEANSQPSSNSPAANETLVPNDSAPYNLHETIHEQTHSNAASAETPSPETPQNFTFAGHENHQPQTLETAPHEILNETFSHFQNAANPKTPLATSNQTTHLPLENAESFPHQTPNENTFDAPFVILEHAPPETPPKVNVEFAAAGELFDAPLKNGEPAAFGKDAQTNAGKEIIFSAPEIAVKAENNPSLPLAANLLPTDKFAAAELKNSDHPISNLANLSPTFAKGNAATHAATENSAAHDSTAAQRENGALFGGALINGKSANSENYDENGIGRVKNSPYGGAAANDFEIGGTSAGATGTLLSAAIGGLALHRETAFGGVLGAVSGVLTGIESSQGILWLGASPALADASETPHELTGNSAPANANLSLQFA